MITDHQKTLIKRTFALIVNKEETVTRHFYNGLFELNPTYRHLFSSEITDQSVKLMQILAIMVRSLDDFSSIIPDIQALAQRHVEYHVKEEDYAVVGETWLLTLAQSLGDVFTPDIKEAWSTAYRVLSNIMIAAAYHQPIVSEYRTQRNENI